ncbi:MAG: flavin-dependent oxidoreductase [Actinomycetota bacterium]
MGTDIGTGTDVLIAGGGIAGLTMALTCHQIGVPARVFESVGDIQPLGVGINLQPNAVRELIDLGLGDELTSLGVETREWALVGRNGNDVYAEPRGRGAGYAWPQYSVHRGRLQMMLYRAVCDRLGADAVTTGARALASSDTTGGAQLDVTHRDGTNSSVEGAVVIAADGLHSALRAQRHPAEGPPKWGGAILWRGTALGPPIRTGASFTLVGSLEQRFVHYPIGTPDPDTGLQLQNWIAELTVDPSDHTWGDGDWNRQVPIEKFLPHFESWAFDWLDVPGLIRSADAVYEFPMVDRDPIDRWVDGRTALIGDAAHAMYPVGSNGASQAIIDTRVLGACMIDHGIGPEALLAYEEQLREPVSAVVLRNRGNGPIAILGVVDDRCGGVFDDIDDVIPAAERDAFMADYKAAAGFAIGALNGAPPTIKPGARVA